MSIERTLLEAMKDGKRKTTLDLMEITGIEKNNLKNAKKRLINAGAIIESEIGRGKSGYKLINYKDYKVIKSRLSNKPTQNKNINERLGKMLRLIHDNDGLTPTELTRECKIGRSSCERYITKLQELGAKLVLIKKEGIRGNYWIMENKEEFDYIMSRCELPIDRRTLKRGEIPKEKMELTYENVCNVMKLVYGDSDNEQVAMKKLKRLIKTEDIGDMYDLSKLYKKWRKDYINGYYKLYK